LIHWDSTAARSAASPAGSPLSVPAVGLGLARTELGGAELCEGDAEAVDDAVDVEVAGSSVSMLTPEADVQPASRTQAPASAAVIAAAVVEAGRLETGTGELACAGSDWAVSDTAVAGSVDSRVCAFTPESVERPDAPTTAHAETGATIDAGSRLRMNAPRDMIATHGDSGPLERGRFINPGHGVNLIKVCTLEVQARE
jgi:hypothetical protein